VDELGGWAPEHQCKGVLLVGGLRLAYILYSVTSSTVVALVGHIYIYLFGVPGLVEYLAVALIGRNKAVRSSFDGIIVIYIR
jgi:hypothetical protein